MKIWYKTFHATEEKQIDLKNIKVITKGFTRFAGEDSYKLYFSEKEPDVVYTLSFVTEEERELELEDILNSTTAKLEEEEVVLPEVVLYKEGTNLKDCFGY